MAPITEWIFIRMNLLVLTRLFLTLKKKIKDADLVAGILLGRVNLEARAMGIVSTIP